MRLEDEFAMYEAEQKNQEHKELAASIARENNLPDTDADLLSTYEDPRMMRALAKRLAEDRPLTPDEQFRANARRKTPRFNFAESKGNPFDDALDQGVRRIKNVRDPGYVSVPKDKPSNFG